MSSTLGIAGMRLTYFVILLIVLLMLLLFNCSRETWPQLTDAERAGLKSRLEIVGLDYTYCVAGTVSEKSFNSVVTKLKLVSSNRIANFPSECLSLGWWPNPQEVSPKFYWESENDIMRLAAYTNGVMYYSESIW